MKTTLLMLAAAGVGLFGSCASQPDAATASPSSTPGANSPVVGYDDRQIAGIQRGVTVEAQLLQWFGSPDSREVKPDGRAQLSWGFSRRTDGGRGHSGTVTVSLTPDGKAEAYSARGGPLEKNRTVDLVEKSDADLREHMAQWQRDGWTVLSVSAPLRRADGTVHRQAKLARSESANAAGLGYDDRQVARIRRGETTQAQLLEWFGPASSRDLKPDGRARLAWLFASQTDGGPGHSGELSVSLTPDGEVDSYSAHRGPR